MDGDRLAVPLMLSLALVQKTALYPSPSGSDNSRRDLGHRIIEIGTAVESAAAMCGDSVRCPCPGNGCPRTDACAHVAAATH